MNALSNQFPCESQLLPKVSKDTLAEKETVHGIDLVVVVQVDVRRSAGCLVEPGEVLTFFFHYARKRSVYRKVRLGLHNLFA